MKMRLTKHVTIGLVAAALAATGAQAHDGPGKDKAADAKARCRPAPVLLMGMLANDPAAGDTSFQLMVKHANRKGRLYAKAANPVSVNVDEKTRIRKDGQSATVDALSQNDRALVLAKVCRADVKQAKESGGALPALTARLVLAKSPKPSGDGDSK
jgi:hypothetical protein